MQLLKNVLNFQSPSLGVCLAVSFTLSCLGDNVGLAQFKGYFAQLTHSKGSRSKRCARPSSGRTAPTPLGMTQFASIVFSQFSHTTWLKDFILKFSRRSWRFLMTTQVAIVDKKKHTASAFLWCSLLHEHV